jgi:hypothetical protein
VYHLFINPKKETIMKPLFTILLLVANLAVFAQHNMSELMVFNDDNKRFAIVIDNQIYKSHNEQSVTVLDLCAGTHAIRVVEYTYDPYTRKNKRRLIYNGLLNLNGQTRYEYVITLANRWELEDAYSLAPHCPGLENPDYDAWDDHVQHTPTYNPTYNPNQCNIMPINEYDRLLSSIQKIPFDDTRKQLFLTAIKNQKLSVAMLSDAMRLFSFEDTKLAIAMKAYPSVCDKKYYYQLSDVFSFASSVDELNTFLQSQN